MIAAHTSRVIARIWQSVCLLVSMSLLMPLPLSAEEEGPIELEESSVIGDQELPVGLDIVPWQPAEPTSVGGTPPQLVTEELEPLDPEVFRRELDLYDSTR